MRITELRVTLLFLFQQDLQTFARRYWQEFSLLPPSVNVELGRIEQTVHNITVYIIISSVC